MQSQVIFINEKEKQQIHVRLVYTKLCHKGSVKNSHSPGFHHFSDIFENFLGHLDLTIRCLVRSSDPHVNEDSSFNATNTRDLDDSWNEDDGCQLGW